jgi:hypothetical protein
VRPLRGRTALAAVVLVAGIAGGCGGSGQSGGEAAADIAFLRADGSAASFPGTLRAWCAPFDEDNPDVESVHVLAGEQPRTEPTDPYWTLSAVRADLAQSPTTTLPHDFTYTEPRGAALFVLDDVEHHSNELSSAAEESTGTIRVDVSGCEPGDTVRLTFEQVTLGSEYFDAPTVSVDGSAEVEISSAP